MSIISKLFCLFNKHKWVVLSENVPLNNYSVTCKECLYCGAFEYETGSYSAYDWILSLPDYGYTPKNEI